MTQSTPSSSPSFIRELPGMLIFFVVILGTQRLAFHFEDPVMEWFSLGGGSPGDAPPWYFITRDYAEGICASGALLLSLVLALITWRWWPTYSSMIVWISLITYGGDIAKSWIIHQSCPGLLDGQRFTNRWPTIDSYLLDSGISQAHTIVLCIGFLLAGVLPLADRYIRRRLTRPILMPTPVERGEQVMDVNRP